jgi:hypothetical protein
MGGKLSAKAQQKLDLLVTARRKTDRLHNLVEQYVATGQDHFAAQISRTGAELGRALLSAGYGVMADYVSQLAMGAKRGGATQAKFRALRDAVAQLRPAIDRAEKQVYVEDQEGPGE